MKSCCQLMMMMMMTIVMPPIIIGAHFGPTAHSFFNKRTLSPSKQSLAKSFIESGIIDFKLENCSFQYSEMNEINFHNQFCSAHKIYITGRIGHSVCLHTYMIVVVHFACVYRAELMTVPFIMIIRPCVYSLVFFCYVSRSQLTVQ